MGYPGQDAFLRRRGCDHLQGYLYSRPVDGPAAEALLGASGFRIPEPRGLRDPVALS